MCDIEGGLAQEAVGEFRDEISQELRVSERGGTQHIVALQVIGESYLGDNGGVLVQIQVQRFSVRFGQVVCLRQQ